MNHFGPKLKVEHKFTSLAAELPDQLQSPEITKSNLHFSLFLHFVTFLPQIGCDNTAVGRSYCHFLLFIFNLPLHFPPFVNLVFLNKPIKLKGVIPNSIGSLTMTPILHCNGNHQYEYYCFCLIMTEKIYWSTCVLVLNTQVTLLSSP